MTENVIVKARELIDLLHKSDFHYAIKDNLDSFINLFIEINDIEFYKENEPIVDSIDFSKSILIFKIDFLKALSYLVDKKLIDKEIVDYEKYNKNKKDFVINLFVLWLIAIVNYNNSYMEIDTIEEVRYIVETLLTDYVIKEEYVSDDDRLIETSVEIVESLMDFNDLIYENKIEGSLDFIHKLKISKFLNENYNRDEDKFNMIIPYKLKIINDYCYLYYLKPVLEINY